MSANAMNDVAHGYRLIKATKKDGHPFGLPPGCADDAHILTIDADGNAAVHRVEAGIAGHALASVESAYWPRIAAPAIADFNRRLAAKGMPAGRFPDRGGHVALHPCFGRELQLAMLAGGDDHPMAEPTLDAWGKLNVRDRLRLWRLVRNTPFRVAA